MERHPEAAISGVLEKDAAIEKIKAAIRKTYGKKGEDVDKLRKVLTDKMGVPVHINIEEIRKPDLDAKLVAQNVAQQLERRVMFRRAMKRVVQNAMRQGAEGIKVQAGDLLYFNTWGGGGWGEAND